ncbi:hypothetical protein QUV83_10855 [Cellulomonas cellasea]|uniref:hypothetical protein n=1 Tax=Cellulomonas cellasea TaxID=43670 RepID=UPI0025A367E7|nr:hypothetical protein [Cellulomonas cellasea]MDM8085264.1 hypothetical protein [Cellulomonas cellasea]
MAVPAFQDYPLAPRDRAWDAAAAEKRVRAFTGAEEAPNEAYRDAHLWYDASREEDFTAHKLLIADVVDGRLEAVPRGVFAAAAVMDGSRGGVDLPAADIPRVRGQLRRYYEKLGEEPPWERD